MATTLPRQYGSTFHRASDSGLTLIGPGDLYRFLVTGEESGGSYFAMEAIVPPCGGPPPHIHREEDETFYVVEGRCDFVLGAERVTAGPGDFVNVPRGTVHCFHNASDELVRLVLTFSPAGIEGFFTDSLDEGTDPAAADLETVVANYAANAPRYGIEFL
jgi:quercetin dioxygenase-like cupin family protein